MVFSHVDVKATLPRDFLELSTRAGGAAKIVKAPDNFQHGRQSHPARIPSQACMRSIAVMDIRLQRPVDADTVRRREDLRIASGADLANELASPLGEGCSRLIEIRTKLQKTLSPGFTETGRPSSSMVIAVVASRYEPNVPLSLIPSMQ